MEVWGRRFTMERLGVMITRLEVLDFADLKRALIFFPQMLLRS